MKNNKVRIGLYLEPQDAATFEMLRRSIFAIEVSQSAMFKWMLDQIFKKYGKK